MIRIPFADNYLDPLLFMPILLHCILWEQRFIFKKGLNFKLGTSEIIIWLIIISILTEYFFPKWNLGFTADIWDVFPYGLGTIFFMLFMNKPIIKIDQ
ncbi:MAG TPA: hypothetical protein VLZ83_00775 [Edaphocola sp.]|nr:hypothetical protein [Edaphocola sp.]